MADLSPVTIDMRLVGKVCTCMRCKSERYDDLVKALEQAKAALLKIRTASIAGCEEGYGKPEKWADELFRSHGDVTASIKAIEKLLGGDVGGSR